MSIKLRAGEIIRTGGPWRFIQLWLTVYIAKGQEINLFYCGFGENATIWCVYVDINQFQFPENSIFSKSCATELFRLFFKTYATTCVFSTGFANGRSHTPYEFYHPSAFARQLGFGQVLIDLFFIGKVQNMEA